MAIAVELEVLEISLELPPDFVSVEEVSVWRLDELDVVVVDGIAVTVTEDPVSVTV